MSRAIEAGYAGFATIEDRRDYIRACLMQEMNVKAVAGYLGLKLDTVRNDLRADTRLRYSVIAYLYGQKGYDEDEIAAALMMRAAPIRELVGRLLDSIGERNSHERQAIRGRRLAAYQARMAADPSGGGPIIETPGARRGSLGDPCGNGPTNVVSLASRRRPR